MIKRSHAHSHHEISCTVSSNEQQAGICESPPLFEALCDEVGALEAKTAFAAARAEVPTAAFAERAAILALAAVRCLI
jgi:hypothetical protein